VAHDLELHQLLRDRPDRLADHIAMLIAQHLPDDLLDRHPVPTGHRRPPFVEASRTPTIMSAAVAGLRSIRPTGSYTNTRDVTRGFLFQGNWLSLQLAKPM